MNIARWCDTALKLFIKLCLNMVSDLNSSLNLESVFFYLKRYSEFHMLEELQTIRLRNRLCVVTSKVRFLFRFYVFFTTFRNADLALFSETNQ